MTDAIKVKQPRERKGTDPDQITETQCHVSVARRRRETPFGRHATVLVRALEGPTLLVIGDSPVVTFAMATELRSLNPRLRIEQIEDAGHGLPFEQPERLGEVVVSFVRELHLPAAADASEVLLR